MSTKVSQILLSLSETDKQIFSLTSEKLQIENRREAQVEEIERMRSALNECEEALRVQSQQQQEEQQKLQGEEVRLSEERKKLTMNLAGGTKQAKLIERQIDIASSRLQVMEDRALKAVEETEGLEEQLEAIKAQLGDLEERFKSDNPDDEKELEKLQGDISSLNKEREGFLGKLDDRLRRLYDRVSMRYPEGGIAICKKGACRSCFRALPPQTYNQVLAGNALVQCPGCSRILVHMPDGNA